MPVRRGPAGRLLSAFFLWACLQREPGDHPRQIDGGPLRDLLNQIVPEFAAQHRERLQQLFVFAWLTINT